MTPNRAGLKDLANLSIDSQFCQQYGTQVFSYQGEVTPQYQQLCANFVSLINDVLADIKAIQAQIPVTDDK